MPAVAEELFLITYRREGLVWRDSWFLQSDAAQRHLAYLSDLFPDAGVELHVIPTTSRELPAAGAPIPPVTGSYLEL